MSEKIDDLKKNEHNEDQKEEITVELYDGHSVTFYMSRKDFEAVNKFYNKVL